MLWATTSGKRQGIKQRDEEGKERKARKEMECSRKLLKVDMESSESEPGSNDADESQDVKVCDPL